MNSPKLFRLVFLSSLAFFFSSSLYANDWPYWRGPDHNGISTEKNWLAQFPAEGPKQLWKNNVGTGFSSMSVSEDRVYTMGNAADTDTVFCFDAETGKQIWKHSYPCKLDAKYYEGGPSVTPTVDGKTVFTFSRKGDLFCLNAGNGKVIWTKNLAKELGAEIPTWGFAGSPLIEKNLLILNVGSGGTALDKSNGKVIWTSDKTVSGYSTAVPADFNGQHCVVFAGAQSVFAVAVADGKKIWEHPWKTQYDVNAADPIISEDKVFISSGYDHGCALLQIKDGKATVLWENKVLKNHVNSSVLLNGFLYGFDGNTGPKADFKCVEFASGTVKWSQPKLGAGALMAADGKLIVITDPGELIIAEATPDSFKPISRAQVLGGRNWITPVLSNGRIYCRNAKGDLVCLDVKGK
jgi:outer membrane protein assembly factor BamB